MGDFLNPDPLSLPFIPSMLSHKQLQLTVVHPTDHRLEGEIKGGQFNFTKRFPSPLLPALGVGGCISPLNDPQAFATPWPHPQTDHRLEGSGGKSFQ